MKKADIVLDGDKIKVSPRLVSQLLKTRSGAHNSRSRKEPTYSDDDAFDAVFVSGVERPTPRVWLGCTGLMRHGKCFNAPTKYGLCYLHQIKDHVSGWQARRDDLTVLDN